MEIRYKISELFPSVKEIAIKIVDTNSWDPNRLREFAFSSETETSFHLDCPMSKCLGQNGITYKRLLDGMVSNNEYHKQERMQCSGYGGYNQTFHCDWFVLLDITITYR